MQKTKKRILWALAVAVSAVVVMVAAVGWRVWQDSAKAATHSCLVNMIASLDNYSTGALKSPLSDGDAWMDLSDDEAAHVIQTAIAARNGQAFDCPPHPSDRPPADGWGRPIRVSARRNARGAVEFKVWSQGRDGEPGTADDIVIGPTR